MSNGIVITAYDSTGAARADSGLASAENVTYTTIYPGGIFGNCTFTLKRDVTSAWSVQLNDRITIRNGLATVWEGYLTGITLTQEESAGYFACTCLGAWGNFLMARKTAKPWAITELTEDIWRVPASAFGASDKSLEDMVEISFGDKAALRFVPNPIAFANGDYFRRVYTCPGGSTIKRIVAESELQEAGQQWLIGVYNQTSGTAENTRTASGQSSFDITFATPAAVLWLYYQSAAGQTATNFNTLHGDFESCAIYGETGDIDLTAIVADVAALCSELSTDTNYIADNSLSLVPFAADPSGETMADVLTRAASFGDSSYNAWAVGVLESDLASDGKPVVFAEQQPALTDADYFVRLGEENVVAPFSATQDISTVRNYIVVTYNDQSGNSVTLTPADDAGLKDQTSIDAYGQRDEWLTLDTTNATLAADYGKRFLAQAKDPRWLCDSGITVVGSIRGVGGGRVAASEIRAGKRVKVENFIGDLNGTGLTFLITGTNYSDGEQKTQISVGQPNALDVWLARVERAIELLPKK